MKKILIILSVFLLAIIYGCNEDTITMPDPPVVIKPIATLKVTINPVKVEYRGDATASWTTSNLKSLKINNLVIDNMKVTINGVKMPDIWEGNIILKGIVRDTTLIFSGISTDGKPLEEIYKIDVGEPTAPTRTDTICGRYWERTETKTWFQDTWSYIKLNEDQLACQTRFYPDGTIKSINPRNNNELVSACNWSWIGKDSILIGNTRIKYKLTDKLFVESERGGTIITTSKGYKL